MAVIRSQRYDAAHYDKKEEFKDISAYGLRTGPNDEVFAYQDNAVKEMYNSRWTKVKAK